MSTRDIQPLLEHHFPRWEELPEYDLYNEQLVQYVTQVLQPVLWEEKALTATMVQNYVKWKILPRPEGKKYNRVHIAWCIAITLLKRVLTIPEIEKGGHLQIKLGDLPAAFNSFCDQVEFAIHHAFSPFEERKTLYRSEGFETPDRVMAIRCVCLSLAYKLATEFALQQEGFVGGSD